MTYDEAIAFIKDLGKFGSRPGLERINALSDIMGRPEKAIRVIHIAGTNGKGSTANMVASSLIASGFRVGLFTSPHLERYTERIKIDGSEIDGERLGRLMDIVSESAVRVDRETDFGMPTEFEVSTALALLYFAEERVDFAVFEVGLGGRYDSTNIVDPFLTIITKIGLDHTAQLGDTIDKIASEKAGIIKEGIPVVSARQERAAEDMIAGIAAEKRAPLIRAESAAGISDASLDLERGHAFTVSGRLGEYRINTRLLGVYQRENAMTAVAALEELMELGICIKDGAISKGISSVEWPGRMELVWRRPYVILDGAHNMDGISALVSSLKELIEGRGSGLGPEDRRGRVKVVFGISADKLAEEMLKMLSSISEDFILTKSRSSRLGSWPPAGLSEICGKIGVGSVAFDDAQDAVRYVLAGSCPDDLILICGSLYLIGEVRPLLR